MDEEYEDDLPDTGDDEGEAALPALGAQEAQYAAPAGSSAGALAPPPYLAPPPGANAQQRRMIDMLNNRAMQEYRLALQERRTASNQRAILERQQEGRAFRAQQAQEARAAREKQARQRNQDRIDAEDRREAVRLELEQRREAQRTHEARMKDDPEYRRNFEMSPLNEEEKKIEDAYGAGSPENLEAQRQGLRARRLDVGTQYAERVRGRRKTDDTEFGTEGTTFDEKPASAVEASGRIKPFVQAYKDLADERRIDEKSGKADEKVANFRPLDKGERRSFFDLLDRISQRGFNDRSPDTLTRAVYNIAYNPVMPVNIDQNGLLSVGDVKLAVSRDEYIQLMAIRGKEAQRLNEELRKSESKGAAKSSAQQFDAGTGSGPGPVVPRGAATRQAPTPTSAYQSGVEEMGRRAIPLPLFVPFDQVQRQAEQYRGRALPLGE